MVAFMGERVMKNPGVCGRAFPSLLCSSIILLLSSQLLRSQKPRKQRRKRLLRKLENMYSLVSTYACALPHYLSCGACTATEMIPTIEMISATEMTPNHHRNDPHHRNDSRNTGNGIKRTTKTGQQFSACFLFIFIAYFLLCVIYLLPYFILQ